MNTSTPPAEPDTLGIGLYLEDLPVGRTFRTVGRTVTEADLIAFVGCTGMTEPLFTNAEYLKHESVIQGRVVPAALVFSFAEAQVLQASLQHTGQAFLGMDFKVERPVLVGDTVHAVVEVVESRRSASRPHTGLVRTRNRVLNQRGETVLVYLPLRLIKARMNPPLQEASP